MATEDQIQVVRTLINDLDFENEIFDDKQVSLIVDIAEGDTLSAAATLARNRASHFASRANTSIDGFKVENERAARVWMDLATGLDKRSDAKSGGTPGYIQVGTCLTGTSKSRMSQEDADPDRYESAFYRGVATEGDTGNYKP